MNKVFKFYSNEDGTEDQDLGILDLLPWEATVHVVSGTINVLEAFAIQTIGEGEDEVTRKINITEFVRQDWDSKEWIEKAWRKEPESYLEQDPDRLHDEFLDREREGRSA